MNAYIREHWLGHYGFLQAVGLNVVLLNTCIVIALHRAIAWCKASDQVPHAFLIFLLLSLCSFVLVWQAVGAFRSATQNIRHYGSAASYYGVLAVMLISGAFVYGSVITLSAGFIDYRQEAVDAYTPPEPTFKLTLSATGSLVFDGDIGRGATTALRNAAKKQPVGTLLLLNSLGGLIVEARGMGMVVEEFGLHTGVAQRCYSACTIVFIAGVERSVSRQGELGFHQYDVYSQSPLPWIEPEKEQAKDLTLFQKKQIAKWFMDKAYSTPHQAIWVPLRDELISAGVVNADFQTK